MSLIDQLLKKMLKKMMILLIKNTNSETRKLVENIFCDKCKFKCVNQNDLVMHVAEHHAVQEVLGYNCKMCGAVFTSENDLKEHSLGHKSTEYKCNMCDYKSDDMECQK